MADIFIKRLEVGHMGTNCYIVMDRQSGEGYVIDPGFEAKKIAGEAAHRELVCKAVLCTHGHLDHVGAVGKVAEALDAPVMISRIDAGGISGGAGSLVTRLSSVAVSKPKEALKYLEDGQELPLGDEAMKVAATPGHSAGSMSFIVEGNIFCGDLVFDGSIGRTDLRGGSMEQLMRSVAEHVWTLPEDTKIWPGHGPATTVGIEMASNPYLRGLTGGR